MKVRGKDLKIGDTIEVWFRTGRDTITALRPYTGPLAYLFPEGAQLADFAVSRVGMTIDNSDMYNVVARAGECL